MSAQHTPGPWILIHDATRLTIHTTRPRCIETGEYTAPSESPQGLIGFVPRPAFSDGAEEVADARLIVAAPDLLQAARDFVAFVEASDVQPGSPADRARAAIARATGEAQ